MGVLLGRIPGGILISVCILFIGCASIPREAPELSIELGNRITAIEKAHLALLNMFFNEKRNRIDDFMNNEYIPTFAEGFFSNPTIKKTINEALKEGESKDILRLFVMLGGNIQTSMNEKRLEFIAPLDEIERVVKEKIREEYNQAKAINNSLTSFLMSAAKLDENRQRYLDMLGLTDEVVGGAIYEVDRAVSGLTSKSEDVEGYIKKLQEIIDSLN